MRIRTTAALAAFLGLSALVSAQQTAQQADAPASAASSDSRATVGAPMHSKAPTPGTASAPSSPKLVRHNPGKGAVTQPASAASQ
jgi:hypothetical protein